jgi:hypothetical protein
LEREVWCVALKENKRFRVFEKEVLRGVFGPKRIEKIWKFII